MPHPPAPTAHPRTPLPLPRPATRALRRAATALLLPLLPLLGACQELGPEQPRVTVRYRELAPLGRERLAVTLDDERRQFYLEGIDLVAHDGWLVSRELRTAPRGDLAVRLALRGAGVAAVAAADVVIPLAPNARWRIDVFPSSAGPNVACAGCAGLHRVPIADAARPSARDWLYVTWTGGAAAAGP